MSRIQEDQQLVPSVLDRLLDDEPENSRETAKSRHQVLRELKQSVSRDLENLLNSRWRCTHWPPDLTDLDESLANYGIPDFTGANFGSVESREQLRAIVEDVIRKFEPRFKHVSVKLLGNTDETDRRLRLRIDALLFAEPAPEPVVFDSQLEPVSGGFAVAGGTA
jgi:type VI secretion system protein ImpF